MAITLKSITRSISVRPPRMILLGVEKIGKSSFAAGADSPIFIPVKMEEGIDALDVDAFPVCNTFDDVMDCLGILASGQHKFKTVVLDSASAFEPIVWASVCADHNVKSIELAAGGYGKGYLAALEKWRELQKALDYLRGEKDMACIIIGHVKVKRFDDPERASYDQYQFDINEKVCASLYRWADFIGFANINISAEAEEVGFRKTKVKGVDNDAGTHYLFTKKTPAHPGGGRGIYGQLPSEIPLDYAAFKSEIADVIKENAAKKKSK